MTMQNPDKPILAKDLNDYHNKILPYLGGMPEVLANKFARGDLYDTNERMIGKWIDGKPLYQKTLNNGPYGPYANGWFNLVPISDINSDIDKLVRCFFTLESIATNETSSVNLAGRVYNNYLQAYNGDSNWNGTPISTITVNYTKTTDQANSFNISSETDYSTEEKIVGTWIDGSYIYQKTYAVNLDTSWYSQFKAETTWSIDLSDLDKIIYSYALDGSFGMPISIDLLQDKSQGCNVASFNATHISYITIQYTKST